MLTAVTLAAAFRHRIDAAIAEQCFLEAADRIVDQESGPHDPPRPAGGGDIMATPPQVQLSVLSEDSRP
ncbi:hypothetical protein ACIO8F_40900 [Streptomyces sp. NPDC087228]|uniref:hypothetical protein n=1 Tax=unclassified Streptomyces TaxID=2593676 RepID=UPI003804476E